MGVLRFLKPRLERRRSPRIDGEDLVAYYWTGTIPIPREVRQIGLYGAYIVAPDRFYPGTLVQIVFEDRATNGQNGSAHPHTCVYAKALHAGADGFCVSFLFGDAAERRSFRRFLNHVKRREPKVHRREPANSLAGAKGRSNAEGHDEAIGGDATDLA